jgi:hypothetical protein
MQWSDLLFRIWLSFMTLMLGTPVFWLIGIERDKRRTARKVDDGIRAVTVESRPPSNERTFEDYQRITGFQRLRLGFKLSVVTVALLIVFAEAYTLSLFVLYAIPIVYVLSIHERANGWKLLGFGTTYRVMWICGITLILSSVSFGFIGILGAQRYALLPSLMIWGAYTYVENRSLNELDKKFTLNLRGARLAALFGILASVAAYLYGSTIFRPDFLVYGEFQFQAFVLGFLLLIVSSALLIAQLGRTAKQMEPTRSSR